MFNYFVAIRKRAVCVLLPVWMAGLLGTAPLLRADKPPGKSSNGVTTTPIEHVVVIFQENVSFDHYFATYPNAANTTPGEPVFNAADDTPSVNGLLSAGLRMHNPNSTQPFRLSRAQAVTCDQDHSYTDEQKSFNLGLMNLFRETVGGGPGTCFTAGKGKGRVMAY